jgi:hypothetical protein
MIWTEKKTNKERLIYLPEEHIYMGFKTMLIVQVTLTIRYDTIQK